MDEINLPLPRQKAVIIRRGRTFSRRTSAPLDRAHVTDEHRGAILEGYAAVADSNTAKPLLRELVRLVLGSSAVE